MGPLSDPAGRYRSIVTIRVVLRAPEGEVVTRDVVDGRWAEPSGDPVSVVGVGSWALPGMVDAHSHIAAAQLDFQPGVLDGAIERARQALAAGVTVLLDKGWRDDTAVRVIDMVPEGERPDIEAAAVLIASEGGYFPGFAREVAADAFLAAVAVAATEGRGWVKLVGDWPRKGMGPIANFTEDQLAAAVSEAGAGGARVAIHTMARDVPSAAVRAGVHSIEHGLFLTEEDLGDLGDRSGMWVPTVRRVEATIAQLGEGSSGGRLLVEGLANVARLLNPAVDAGVHVLAGTDLVGTPATVAAEALALMEQGLSPERVVAAVSVSPLRATGRPVGFGVGDPADAVLFHANPVEEPGVLAHPALVIRRGRVLP
jgi:imidazolonepropionase-like amidohydrolase